MEKINIKNYSISEIENLIEDFGEKRYRAKQIFSWLAKGTYDFDEMSNISKFLRSRLQEKAYIENIIPKKILTSGDETRKYLFQLSDGYLIESVYMKYKHGNSVCISSQVGCKMGCSFCASTIGGLKRNLLASEMVEQVLKIKEDVKERISHIVVMGSGEPFENYNQLLKFLTLVHSEEGLNIGWRNMTVSTCGIIPKIIDFAKKMPQVTLAISLHAPNDKIRNQMMGISKRYPMTDLLKVCQDYIRMTNRRITFEYALIDGINDLDENAKELAEKIKHMLCHVNLIPLNKVEESQLSGSSKKRAERFKEILEAYHIHTTIRRELGDDIEAACGQLRRRYEK